MSGTSQKINLFELRGMVRDPKRFIGRRRELDSIFSHLATMQSVSVVGERLIGKSSLLNHIVQVGKERLGGDYEFFYLDLERVFSARDFYERACEMLGNGRDGLPEEADHRAFEKALRGRRVVFCLDEFEQTIYEPDFGPEFFNVLRSLAQTGELALVIATKHKLHDLYRNETELTSPFYNIFPTLVLGPLTEEEARELARIPAKEAGHPFSEKEIDLVIELAGTHPYRLNLACSLLYQAKIEREESGGSVDWDEIRRRFAQRIENTSPVDESQQSHQISAVKIVTDQSSTLRSKEVRNATALFVIGCVFFFVGVQFAIPLSMGIAAVIFLIALWLMVKDMVNISRTRSTKDKLS